MSEPAASGWMMDIGELLRTATARLAEAGCDSPRLDAELLLGAALGLTRTQLLVRWDETVSAEQEQAYLESVHRRVQREPLAYVLGHWEFFGLQFEVNPHVLVPRPETELLVEEALKLALETDPDGAVRVADIGTGSGAIAVSIAVSLPRARVVAVDSSAAALAVAVRNSRRHGVDSRIRFLEGDLLSVLPEPVDLVLANLPYVAQSDLETLMPEVGRFEPVEALVAGDDGLDLIRRLLIQVGQLAEKPRAVLLEIGATQGPLLPPVVGQILPEAGVSLLQDYAG